MNELNKIAELLEEITGKKIELKIIEINNNKNDDEVNRLDACFDYLDRVSPSEHFDDDLISFLVTIENAVQDIKKRGKEYSSNPEEVYVKDINDMLNDIIESGNYTIEIKVK